ncbi:MAG TPA: oligopeptide:H+ symporter [Kofleriaceae bacterium]|nr:oligopeptide:H+ symporter [Kofleriaceae bacterium]
MSDAPPPPARMPSQIPFIIGNEACERFSYYGMRNILTTFLPSSIILMYLPAAEREGAASTVFHTFAMGVYFFPLLGGWLSDRFFGKFNTIFWFSLVYCVGQGMLATFPDNRAGFYTGLLLIALGSGGIKPLVSAFVGDQFDSRTKHLAKVVYDAFYWSINFGSFFASLLLPFVLREYGPRWAFGIPGILMFVATVIFVIGKPRYVQVPPTPQNPHSFLRVVRTALASGGTGQAIFYVGLAGAVALLAMAVSWFVHPILLAKHVKAAELVCLALLVFLVAGAVGASSQLERARGAHPDEAVDGVRAVLRILIVFSLVTPFWTLFDQKASTWVFQGKTMTQPTWFEPAQMQLVNPALVMLLIPFNNLVLFPWLRKRGFVLAPLSKMTAGMALAGMSYVVVFVYQMLLDGGSDLWIYWQIVPYVLLTMGEVLVSATGLEFAYSQAPLAMKGVIMSFWNLAVTFGNLWTLLAKESVHNPSVTAQIERTGISKTAFLMAFFALFAFAAALAFRWYARRYKVVDNYIDRAPAAPTPTIPKATARDK